MTVRVGISGFGRIGRNVFRILMDDPEVELVAINDLKDTETLAHLVRYDSIMGRFDKELVVDGMDFIVDGVRIKGLSDRDPSQLPWGDLGVDVVIESTGKFRTGETAGKHLDGGARKVLITAPGTDVDNTLVMGVNHEEYDGEKDHVVSNASCTTNCLAPVAKVLLDEFGIERGFMNTIHSYTSDQNILDARHKDLRRARAAAVSMVPTTTGAARAVSIVLPELKGKLDGFATRVPTPNGSMVDLTVELSEPASVERINAAMKAAAEGPLAGILEYTEDPIVSVDVIGTSASAIFDSKLTMVLGGEGTLIKVIAWYDNENGYSSRVVDLAKYLVR